MTARIAIHHGSELAAAGHWFLVVPCGRNEANVPTITQVAREHHATRAQRYGSLMIEELLDVGEGLPQAHESPDTELDAQTRSGQEASRNARLAGAERTGQRDDVTRARSGGEVGTKFFAGSGVGEQHQ